MRLVVSGGICGMQSGQRRQQQGGEEFVGEFYGHGKVRRLLASGDVIHPELLLDEDPEA